MTCCKLIPDRDSVVSVNNADSQYIGGEFYRVIVDWNQRSELRRAKPVGLSSRT
jgi:hypothetical protein